MNIKKEIKIIQIKAEEKLGFPLAERFWDLVQDDVGNAATDYDGDPEGQAEYIESYRNLTERYVMVLSAQPSIKAKPTTVGNVESINPKRIYRKPFERRLHLLEFVWGEKGGSRARANWKHLTTVWNKEHPYDQKTQGVLKVEYYRTVKDRDVINNLVALRILPRVKLTLAKFIDLWEKHPEVKNLNDLNELEDAPDEAHILTRGKGRCLIIFRLGKDPNIGWYKVTLEKNPNTGKSKAKFVCLLR